MRIIRMWAKAIANNHVFELSITAIIIINSVLIGVETYTNDLVIQSIQKIILGIFTAEIIVRFIAADSIKSFFKDGWNLFDLSLVIIGYLPENLIANGAAMTSLRVLRVFRVLRLLRASKEIKLIVTVLMKSMTAMFYNVILFFIFIYLYAIIGVGIFRLPKPDTLSGERLAQYEQYVEAVGSDKDPYGTLGEAMFTLFRELTGDDWTDIRYNHITACECGILKLNPTVVTIYHVSWFILAAFLLLNLVTGAIVNNYQLAIDEQNAKKDDHHADT